MNGAMKLPMAMPEDAGLEARRQAVIDVLKDRFARGEIELDEYERRIAVASEAQRIRDLSELVADLSRSAAPPAVGAEAPQQLVAVMSSRTQVGDWLRADSVVVYALMGSVVLDFTDVRPGERPVVVEVRALMSEVNLKVPAGMPVHMDVHTFMAEASVHRSVSREPVTGPGIVVRGVAVMSEVSARAPR